MATDSSRKQVCADDIKCSKAFQTSDQCISSLLQRLTMLVPNMHQIFSDVNTVGTKIIPDQDVQYPIISYRSNIQYPTKRTQSAKKTP